MARINFNLKRSSREDIGGLTYFPRILPAQKLERPAIASRNFGLRSPVVSASHFSYRAVVLMDTHGELGGNRERGDYTVANSGAGRLLWRMPSIATA